MDSCTMESRSKFNKESSDQYNGDCFLITHSRSKTSANSDGT